jgi:hypothetical protein
MARTAVGNRMRPDKRKTALRVLLKFRSMADPIFRSMARLALCPELSPVDIRMAIRAGRLRLDEPEIGVAGCASGLGMSADQRKSGFTMRKPRWIAHLMPGLERVALLAIPFYFTMGILVARLAERST